LIKSLFRKFLYYFSIINKKEFGVRGSELGVKGGKT